MVAGIAPKRTNSHDMAIYLGCDRHRFQNLWNSKLLLAMAWVNGGFADPGNCHLALAKATAGLLKNPGNL